MEIAEKSERNVSNLTKNTLALVLAGGRGSRLSGLTDWRAKPGVPFGGKFRIIDFPLSNCINSEIRRVSVMTQYKAHSLILHIQKGWNFLRAERNEFVEIIPAQQRLQGDSWYRGTADAVYQNLDIIRTHNPEYVLILAGDHIYKMDYGPMLSYHVNNQADLTIGCLEVDLETAKSFGIMSIDDDKRIRRFNEKPSTPEAIPGKPDLALASMGIYVFNAKFLYEQLRKDADTSTSSHDFGNDIIPSIISKYRAFAYPFVGVRAGTQKYWRDVGTVDAFWEANMELVSVEPQLNLYDREWPIWTYQEQLPPAKFIFDDDDKRGMAVDSMVSGACIISGALVRHSLLFSNVRIEKRSTVEDCVILPDVRIGCNCILNKVVFDKGCEIPDNTTIGVNHKEDLKRGFYISPKGVVLVTPDMLGQDLHHAR
jgi:glucose-1-phosphate adenylyltransferase